MGQNQLIGEIIQHRNALSNVRMKRKISGIKPHRGASIQSLESIAEEDINDIQDSNAKTRAK